MKIITTILILIFLFLSGCDQGLSPNSTSGTMQKSGFSGTITFVGNWPEGITRTHIIVFKSPINSPGDFNVLNLGYISYEIPYGTKVFSYNTAVDSAYFPLSPGDYSYVVVAQSKTPTVSFNRVDWNVIGVYYALGDTVNPGKISILENKVVPNINIICNFNSPPPQPPGGQ